MEMMGLGGRGHPQGGEDLLGYAYCGYPIMCSQYCVRILSSGMISNVKDSQSESHLRSEVI